MALQMSSNVGTAPVQSSPWLQNPEWNSSMPTAYRTIENPLWWQPNTGGAFSGGTGFGGGGISGGNFGSSSMGNLFSSGNVNNSFSGGGSQEFNANQPEGFNPYQFMPSFQQFQRPDSPVAGPSEEEEYLRQFMMGQLLGEHPGEDAAYNELMKTIQGDYMHPDSNPYLTEMINSLGMDTTQQLNKSVNDILSRSGTAGALGGSRSALMQGQAAGETTRGFNEQISNLLNQNYQGERNRQLGATQTMPGLEGLATQRTGQALGLAGIPREFEQKLIDAQMQEWLRMQNERFQPIQIGQSILGQGMGQTIPIVQPQQSGLAGFGQAAQGLGGLLSGIGGLGGGSSGGGLLGGLGSLLSPLGGLFGAGSAGAGAAAPLMGEMFAGGAAAFPGALGSLGIFSSRKFKEIKPEIEDSEIDSIVEQIESMPIYRWKYKAIFNDSKEHIGPMVEDSPKDIVSGDSLDVINVIGVLLASVKSMSKRLKVLEAKEL